MKAKKSPRPIRRKHRIVALLSPDTAVPLTCSRCGGALARGHLSYSGEQSKMEHPVGLPIASVMFDCIPCKATLDVRVDTDRVTFTLSDDV